MSDVVAFRDELLGLEDSTGAEALEYRERAFSERICELLGDAEVAEDLVTCMWRGTGTSSRKLGVDAASFQSQDGSATLMLTIFSGESGPPGTLSQSDMVKHAQRLRGFAEEALAGGLKGKLRDNSPEEDLRNELEEARDQLIKLRLFLVTDLKLGERVKELPAESAAGVPCEYHIWDIVRLAELSESGHEPLEIDLESDFGQTVACLPAHLTAAEYRSYLCVVPAQLLADLYEKFGARLLETNVRGFLSERGKVNRGIRSTIQNSPQMFFAYNNGLTATASSVQLNEDNSKILGIKDLQIVNGGQTTASLFWARKKHKADLASVSVQMKLSVIPDSLADSFDEIVGKISEYANSQNKVSEADLSANRGFHREMEKISKRAGVSPVGGGRFQTYWFYERARAQFDNERRALSKAEQQKFDLRYPKSQLISKTDLAKYWSCWEQLPQFVSRGAQKNFQKFAGGVKTRWDKNPNQFNETFYKRIVGVAILYKAMESTIQKEEWYDGYRINIIAYTLGLLFRGIESEGKRLNLLSVWSDQALEAAATKDLVDLAKQVYDEIRNCPTRNSRPQWGNLGQWFKEEKCWEYATDIRFEVPKGIRTLLISPSQYSSQDAAANKAQRVDETIDAQVEVARLQQDGYWQRLHEWNQEDPVLTELEQEAVIKIARSPMAMVPPERMCLLLVNARKHAESEGFA